MTSLLRRGLVALAVGASAAALPAQGTPFTPPYGPTLTFGTGLVNIPTAWVSPVNGEVWFTGSSRASRNNAFKLSAVRDTRDQTFNLDAHFLGRFSVGGSIYSLRAEQVGAFAQALLLRANAETPRWMPSIAVGVRGLGASARQDRFVTGNARVAPANISGNPTFYGVATKEFGTAQTAVGVTAGFGSGFFKNDAGLGTVYNAKGGTGGAFGGVRVSHIFAGGNVQLTAVAENDAWDTNAGVVATIRHWNVGVLATELDEAGGAAAAGRLAGWTKVNVLVGYNGSIPAMMRGTLQRAELTDLDVEAQELRREVAQRERRRVALEREIARAQTKVDASSASKQAALQKQLESERDAIKKANERLDTVQKTKPPEGR
jgi:hypothetical protein